MSSWPAPLDRMVGAKGVLFQAGVCVCVQAVGCALASYGRSSAANVVGPRYAEPNTTLSITAHSARARASEPGAAAGRPWVLPACLWTDHAKLCSACGFCWGGGGTLDANPGLTGTQTHGAVVEVLVARLVVSPSLAHPRQSSTGELVHLDACAGSPRGRGEY